MARSAAFVISAVLVASVCFADEASPIAIENHQDYLDFRIGKDLVTRYHIEKSVAKPYFWPLYGPRGVAMTRAWPMEKAPPGGSTDHVHQKSVWFCHGDVIPEGISLKNKVRGVEGIDFWSETKGHGRIVCMKVGEAKTERNHGWVATENQWQTADGVPVLEEKRVLYLYDFGETRLLVVDIDLEARYAAITFGDTKEGAFGVRVNDLIREEKGNGKIENAEGKIGEKNCWGRLSHWCDYSGTIDGQTVGIAILVDHLYWSTDPTSLRYGLLLHPGDAKEGKVSEFYERFVKLKK